MLQRTTALSRQDFRLSPEEAFTELLGSDPSPYGDGVPMHLATYEVGKVALPRILEPPQLLQDLLRDSSKEYLADLPGLVLRDVHEWNSSTNSSLPKPYMDPVLRKNRPQYDSLVTDLRAHHVLSFTSDPLSHCTIFLVREEDGSLRMVTDAPPLLGVAASLLQ